MPLPMVPAPRTATVRMSSEELSGTDALGGDFYFAYALEGEQQLDQISLGIFLGPADDLADGVRDGGVEEDSLHLDSGEVYANGLAWGECHFRSYRTICGNISDLNLL